MNSLNTGPDTRSWSQMTPEEQAEAGAKVMIEYMQSCPGKTVLSGVTGFLLGGFFGLFMASMAYEVPVGSPLLGQAAHISDLPWRQQLKLQFADLGKKSWSSAKNFGYIGAIFTAVECSIETVRAKNDIYNGAAAGCVTGGGLLISGGPQLALIGCAGFAAFSTLIDLYMRSEDGKPPKNDYDD